MRLTGEILQVLKKLSIIDSSWKGHKWKKGLLSLKSEELDKLGCIFDHEKGLEKQYLALKNDFLQGTGEGTVENQAV